MQGTISSPNPSNMWDNNNKIHDDRYATTKISGDVTAIGVDKMRH
jgi:hypothetical protein